MSHPLPAHKCVNLACLRAHLEEQSLPDGWVKYAECATEGAVVLAKLSVNVDLLSATATLLLKVDEDLGWRLSCHGTLVEVGQSRVLTAIPPRLDSTKAVLDLLSTLQGVAVCSGNAVDDFRLLVDARGGEFKDATGAFMCKYVL